MLCRRSHSLSGSRTDMKRTRPELLVRSGPCPATPEPLFYVTVFFVPMRKPELQRIGWVLSGWGWMQHCLHFSLSSWSLSHIQRVELNLAAEPHTTSGPGRTPASSHMNSEHLFKNGIVNSTHCPVPSGKGRKLQSPWREGFEKQTIYTDPSFAASVIEAPQSCGSWGCPPSMTLSSSEVLGGVSLLEAHKHLNKSSDNVSAIIRF